MSRRAAAVQPGEQASELPFDIPADRFPARSAGSPCPQTDARSRSPQGNRPGRVSQPGQDRGRDRSRLRAAGDGVPLAALDADCFLPVPNTSATFAARVFAKIDASGDCWEWTGTLDAKGYGVIGRGRRGTGNMLAHRAVWELLVGPIPEGMHFDHLCRNHSCVCPDHGEIVTPEENKRRGFSVAVLYSLRTTCDYGHPLDGMLGGQGGKRRYRYCKTCARERRAGNAARKEAA